MECIIPGENIKVLSRIINALSKIGDDIYLEAKTDCLCLKSVNMTTTAYCTINLYEIFFTTYEAGQIGNDVLSCRLPMKGILGVFKSHGHKDKKPEFCKIVLKQSDSKIIFKFRYKHDVSVVRSLYLNDGDIIDVVYDRTKVVNYIGASAEVFAQVLMNFQMSDEDMSIEVTSEKALIRNYIAGESSISKGIRSQISLMPAEFSNYRINTETNVTFSLKGFRAAVHFAETYRLSLLINFEETGRPALIEIKNPTFDINFIIATLKRDNASQSSLSSTVHLTRKRNATQYNFNEPIDTEKNDNGVGNDIDDVVPQSPESPRSKKIKSIFGRCYDATFRREAIDLGKVLASDSDPDSD
ncbi:hypothetical protein RN001_011090 [Aquatica leii]|uniref:Cell cycle checkpoint control protein RAD9A n=1 Tax=Aquatica leii TaxID=1421715 RepID=A0AAN7PVL6_9COLE|nr:hypothetical protein RN001_011090 [Aquatica leii]